MNDLLATLAIFSALLVFFLQGVPGPVRCSCGARLRDGVCVRTGRRTG